MNNYVVVSSAGKWDEQLFRNIKCYMSDEQLYINNYVVISSDERWDD